MEAYKYAKPYKKAIYVGKNHLLVYIDSLSLPSSTNLKKMNRTL